MMPDWEKVRKGLECCSVTEGLCWKCPYETHGYFAECTSALVRDALAMLNEQVVLCKDCEYFNDYFAECKKNNHTHGTAWFCADGKRRAGDA